jgi:hypothetical protein
MQCLTFIMEVFGNLDIDLELTTFLCSFILFAILNSVRNRHLANNAKIPKVMEFEENENATDDSEEHYDDAQYIQHEKAFQNAFDDEDYWQALKHWDDLKYSRRSSIHLPMMIRAMRSCNKGAYFVSTELRNYFRAHHQIVSIDLLNDLLEPVARRADEAQLAELIFRMIPSIRLRKDARTYEILLTMHVANRNLAKAQDVVAEMKTQRAAFTPRATVAVMRMGLQNSNFEVVMKSLTKLKPSWNIRDTWAVSMFALEREKTSTLKQIVELAYDTHRMAELLPIMVGMTVPDDVLGLVRAKLNLLSDTDVATVFAVLKKSCSSVSDDAIYNTVVGCLTSHAKNVSLPRAVADASTSEGSRSDSEEESMSDSMSLPAFKPPPGLSRA